MIKKTTNYIINIKIINQAKFYILDLTENLKIVTGKICKVLVVGGI